MTMVNHESDSDYMPTDGEDSSEELKAAVNANVKQTPGGPKKKPIMRKPKLDMDDDDEDDFDEENDSSDDDKYPGPAMLVVNIEHQGKQHALNKDDKITYYFKKADGSLSPLTFDDDDVINIQHEDKVMQLKKSVVDDYRRKTKYWGPLKASVERCKVMRNSVEKEVLRTKLNQIKFTAKDKAGNWLTGEGLRNAMAKTPGVIPPCDPLNEPPQEETLSINLDASKGIKVEVKKKAIDEFKKLSGVDGPLKTQVKKVIQKKNGIETAITKLFLSSANKMPPKRGAPSIRGGGIKRQAGRGFGSPESKRGRPPKHIGNQRLDSPMKKFPSDKSYSSFAERSKAGMFSHPFTQPKSLLGSKFLQEVCAKTYEVESPLGAFGCYKGRTTRNTPEDQDNTNHFIPNDQDMDVDVLPVESTPPNMRQMLAAEQLWGYLTDCAQTDNYLLDFVYAIDQDRWLEVKRSSEMVQINGEVSPDMTLKVVLRDNTVKYFLRVLGRLIKSGNLSNGLDVKNLLRCMASNRRICVGLSMDPYLEILDKNEQLRTCLKDSTQIVMSPYMSVHSRHCQGIVRAPNEPPNGSFTRGGVSIIGSEILCQVCIGLGRKLNIISQDTDEVPKKDTNGDVFGVKSSLPIKKPTHIPVQKLLKNSKLKELFTETLDDILEIGPRKLNSLGLPKTSSLKQKLNNEDDCRPSIVTSESDFMKMIVLQTNIVDGQRKLQKMCHLCKFKPSSILALFSHMQSHLGELTETCIVCNLKLSSKQALASHMKISHAERAPICSICEADFQDKEQLFDHMNKHRKIKPFTCSHCDLKIATLELLKKHLKHTHSVKSIKELNHICKSCNVYFYTKDHLLIHRINQNHDGMDPPLTCRQCMFSSPSADTFRAHIWQHTSEQREAMNLVGCELCQRVFFSNFRLQYHMDAKHAGQKLQPRVFLDMPAKADDMPTVEYPKMEEVFICDKCERTFKTFDILEKHKLACPVILREKSLAMKQATQTIPQPVIQQQPVVTTPQVNEFVCEFCSRKFPNMRMLSSHRKIHSGNKPVFQCEECGQIYGKKQQVLEHIKSDHAEQVHQHQQQQQLQLGVPQPVVQIMQQVDGFQQQHIEGIQQTQHVVETTAGSWSPLKNTMKMTDANQEPIYSLMQESDFSQVA